MNNSEIGKIHISLGENSNNSEIGKITNSQDEIADEVGCDSRTVRDVLGDSEDLPESLKPDANHLTEFQTSTE